MLVEKLCLVCITARPLERDCDADCSFDKAVVQSERLVDAVDHPAAAVVLVTADMPRPVVCVISWLAIAKLSVAPDPKDTVSVIVALPIRFVPWNPESFAMLSIWVIMFLNCVARPSCAVVSVVPIAD